MYAGFQFSTKKTDDTYIIILFIQWNESKHKRKEIDLKMFCQERFGI